MKKLGIVLGVFVSLFLGSCEKQSLEKEIYEKKEILAIDKDDASAPGSGGGGSDDGIY